MIDELVRRAAAVPRPHHTDLAEIQRRAKRRRRRRRSTAVAAAALAVLATATAVPFLKPAPAPTTPAAISQRLVYVDDGRSEAIEGFDFHDGFREVPSSGQVVAIPKPAGLYEIVSVAGPPSGGLVVLGTQNGFVVTAADGSIVASRTVKADALLGATATTAWLLRSDAIATYDLASGAERVVAVLDSGVVAGGDVAGEVAAVVLATSSACTVTLVDLRTGIEMRRLLRPDRCGPVRVSPDGRYVALTYVSQGYPDRTIENVAIFETATGRLLLDRVLPTEIHEVRRYAKALAWSDATTVRAAWTVVPRGAGFVHPPPVVMRTAEFTVR